jgi:hypothetical protein
MNTTQRTKEINATLANTALTLTQQEIALLLAEKQRLQDEEYRAAMTINELTRST